MTLALYFLGSPRLELRERQLKLGIKPLLVLAYLALEGRASRRDLARLLWSNASDPLNSVSAARVSLRDLIKKQLRGDNETLFLQGAFTCDVQEFMGSLESTDPEIWRLALGLHQGEFLEGVRLPEWEAGFGADFEEWLLSWREKLEEVRSELAWRVAREYLKQQQFELAMPLLEITQVDTQPPREDATRLLMLTAGALGREIRAQTAYQKLERRLQDELELRPSEQTRLALQQAKQNPQICQAALREELRVKHPTISSTLGLEDTTVPLFGRENELQHIALEQNLAWAGAARLVLLIGEPGVGKSRLAQEAARQARGAFVLNGVTSSTGVSLGLFDAPVRRALRTHKTENFNRLWQQALADFVPDAINATHLDPSKEHLFAAITALFAHPEKPTVLLLDDLQWADKTSLELLLHLMHAPQTHGILILATLRNTENPRSDLKNIIEIITREQMGIRLEIQGISQQAVANLTDALGRQTDPVKLHQKSGGNPFYILEMLRLGADSSQMHDLIQSRLVNLSDTSQQLLEVAALLGNGHQLGMLRNVSGRSLEEISQALDELAMTDILHLLEDGTHFKHDLIREVILEQIRPARKQILHLRAARALKPNQAANHALLSKDAWEDTDRAKMLQCFLETGKQHSIRGDLTTALEWFEHADKNSQNATERLQALTERASTLERYGRHDAALETLSKVEILEGSVTDPVLRSGAWLAKANLLALKMHRLEEAQVLVSQAFTALEGLSYSAAQLARSDALNIQGTIYRLEKKYLEAVTAFEASLSIRQALEDDAKAATAMMNLAMTYAQIGDRRTQELYEQCLALYKKLEDVNGLSRTYNNLGLHYRKLGLLQKALKSYQESLQLNQQLLDPWAEARAYLNLGVTHFYLTNYVEAKEHYQLALEKAKSLQDLENQLVTLLNLLEVSKILESNNSIWIEQIKPFADNETFIAYHPEINSYLAQGVKT
jgi:predicted ATPase/DNA-binding SARP family transcriptional activator